MTHGPIVRTMALPRVGSSMPAACWCSLHEKGREESVRGRKGRGRREVYILLIEGGGGGEEEGVLPSKGMKCLVVCLH